MLPDRRFFNNFMTCRQQRVNIKCVDQLKEPLWISKILFLGKDTTRLGNKFNDDGKGTKYIKMNIVGVTEVMNSFIYLSFEA